MPLPFGHSKTRNSALVVSPAHCASPALGPAFPPSRPRTRCAARAGSRPVLGCVSESVSGSVAPQGTGAGDSHLKRHLYHYHLPRSHYERGVDPALRRAEKMLPLSIKDDEYKPPKFNLFRKISGWFRCGELCLREVGVRHEGRRPKSKDGPRSREGATGTPSFV